MKSRLKKCLRYFTCLSGKHKILLWGNLCCIILSLTAAAFLNHVCTSQPDQQAVQRWAADKSARFAQLSCFFVHDSGITAESVQQLRSDINKHLLESSISSSNKEARLWYDAYSTEGSLSVSRGSVTAKASATAVGWGFLPDPSAILPLRLLLFERRRHRRQGHSGLESGLEAVRLL